MKWAILPLCALCVGGCARPKPVELELPAAWETPLADSMAREGSIGHWRWWKGLGDPLLTMVLEELLSDNPDLGRMAPMAQFSAELKRDYGQLWHQLAIEAARSYFELRSAQKLLSLHEESVQAQRETVQITQTLVQAGLANAIGEGQAMRTLQLLEVRRPELELAVRQANYRLAQTTGHPPVALARLLEVGEATLMLPCSWPVGSPSELLCTRSELIKAKRAKEPYGYKKAVLGAIVEAEQALASFLSHEQKRELLDGVLGLSCQLYQETLELYRRGLVSYLDLERSQRTLIEAKEALVENEKQLLLDYVAFYSEVHGRMREACR